MATEAHRARWRRMLILTEGRTDRYDAKAAVGLIRYRRPDVVGILDSENAGKNVGPLLGLDETPPVVADVASALPLGPETFVIGIAPRGGALPKEWRRHILDALEAGLDVVSGLHDFLADDPEFAEVAARNGRTLYDVRKPPDHIPVGANRAAELPTTRVLTVGTDCNIGKMHAALELRNELARRGHDVDFVATGQIGILISGRGVPVDHVLSDFVAGCIEQELLERRDEGHELFIVEGQGAVMHPGFSGVTVGLMHGSAPHAMILCHHPLRTVQRGGAPIPPLAELVALHEALCRPVFPSKVIAVSLNCGEMDAVAAREAVARVRKETGLPATDPVKFGAGPLADAVEAIL